MAPLTFVSEKTLVKKKKEGKTVGKCSEMGVNMSRMQSLEETDVRLVVPVFLSYTSYWIRVG